jgi:hypothetical protein
MVSAAVQAKARREQGGAGAARGAKCATKGARAPDERPRLSCSWLGSLHAQAAAVLVSDAADRSRSPRACRQLSSPRGMRGVSPAALCALLAARREHPQG